ncbi:MAG: hypothetical protein IAE99_00775 [Rhodothermales bacterium]|nr:hypothetical protein [Rhodothermales bacterium]
MIARFVAPLAASLVLAACAAPVTSPVAETTPPASSDSTQVCTMEYRSYAVRVQTASGQPVTDARLAIRRSDGTDLACTADGQQGCVAPRGDRPSSALSTYTVMTDGIPISRSGENITVTATSDGKSVVSVFRFQNDGCHVRKVSGPDVLTLGD